mmetsp:Transcript_8414/g.18191  ORF Transcript_8414/g.18191 Transcript_8414/m.18191 type:complete len:387 (-) Transcript_8414:151-1311(-)|eukprot:CAMPEP_0172534788 /NCGR_PEP_ID=MMETSP1067-20121228/7034_1 /TAXON_ID=265564 ORGANISM="Thalassiosira punctigera, Strain Tpunct2005C2" /NCGR_SAMPLE_ID=MMETSP1067 /ASSEMBLY_ACC=CAM_ASM_000444 /LENGTH=386 /DNA_ID=CAMNT_0013319625 /DNA_START=61 /DNA_END=1221 /DNA_ORIENTATION=-
MADDKSASAGSAGKPSKPVIRGKGKGKALNAIAAASGRDPAAIVKSVTEAEAAAKAAAARAQAEEAAKKVAEAQSRAKAKEEVTATQIYDSLSPQEQHRFECFRRCGFASKPIEKFVAKTLIDEAEKRYLVRRGAMVGLGGNVDGGDGNVNVDATSNDNIAAAVTDASDADSSSKKPNVPRKRKKQSKKHILREESKRRRAAMNQPLPYFLGGSGNGNGIVGNGSAGASARIPPLENLVVPGSASEIVAVVSTLAKCYGQRLVAAAKRVADAEEEEKEMDGTSSSSMAQKPLLPHHFLEAHRHRARAGVDPGFWMADRTKVGKRGYEFKKGGVGTAEAAALGTVDRDRACHLAALAAQDEFDREVEKEEEDERRRCEEDKMEVEGS